MNFLPFISLVNEFAVQPACDPKKVSPILGSKSLLRWTLLLGVPPGEKWPVNHLRGQRWILWHWCSGKCITQDYKCTYIHSQPLKCWMSSLNLEYPGTFCLNCHVECFSDTHRMNRSCCDSNTQVASWLDLMISHTNRCLPGIFQVWRFWCLGTVGVIDELYTLFQLILLCSHLSKEWGSNGIFQPCLFWTHYSPCKSPLTSSGPKQTTAVISDTVDSCWKSCTTPGISKIISYKSFNCDGLPQPSHHPIGFLQIPSGIPDDPIELPPRQKKL